MILKKIKHKRLYLTAIIGISAAVLSVVFSSNIYYKTIDTHILTYNVKPIPMNVKLYQHPNNHAKVLKNLSYKDLNTYQPVFVTQNGWVKVSNTTNDSTAWVAPLNERIKPFETALSTLEKQQNLIADKYQTEILKTQAKETKLLKQMNAINIFNEQHLNTSVA